VNLALGGLPTFSALDATEGFLEALSGRIHIGPEIDYLERAFDASKYGDFSKAPILMSPFPPFSIRPWLRKANMFSLPAFNMPPIN